MWLKSIQGLRTLLYTLVSFKFVALRGLGSVALGCRNFLDTLDSLKFIALLCLVFAAFVIFPDQTLELYRYTAQSLAMSYNSRFSWKNAEGFIETTTLFLSTCITSLLFLCAASLLYSLRRRCDENRDTGNFSGPIFSLIACVPSLAVAMGMYRATIDNQSPQLKSAMLAGASASFEKDVMPPESIATLAEFDVASQLYINWWLYSGAIAMILVSAVFYLVAPVLFRRMQVNKLSRARGNRLMIAGFALPVFFSALFLAFPVELARFISAFAIICLFFCVITLFLVAISLLQARVRKPILFILLTSAIVFNLAGLNDNHDVREFTSSTNLQVKRVPHTIAEGFAEWLEKRKDTKTYRAYPVYVVAAEGGGIYAAFRTAAFLASLQDLCPRFSHHLFAISSVSGGSVGAVIYNGLTRKIKESSERFEPGLGCTLSGSNTGGLFYSDVAEDVLRDDFLSPVLAAFLFPDFLQRFLFFPIAQLDRTIALEKSLEQSWDDKVRSYYDRFRGRWVDNGNPLRDSFATSWNSDGDSPALFINTTEIQSGRGRVITPFSVETEEYSSLPLLQPPQGAQDPGVDISMSTAAVLSARFPWLTPPGSIHISVPNNKLAAQAVPLQERKIQLVDGGYLDNSGVSTALTIVRAIDKAVVNMSPPPEVEINLIVLTSARFANPEVGAVDYLAPIQALLTTRAARSSIAIEQAEQFFKRRSFKGRQANRPMNSIEKAVLEGYGYPLALGWRLSPITRLLILGRNGDPSRCESNIDGLNCMVAEIYEKLKK
jgi:hypothetical protein